MIDCIFIKMETEPVLYHDYNSVTVKQSKSLIRDSLGNYDKSYPMILCHRIIASNHYKWEKVFMTQS